MKKYDCIVIGGGASGIAAAISAGRSGKSVLICERLSKLGKKILASGGGRSNFLNDDLSYLYYNHQAKDLVESIFKRFDNDYLKQFFQDLGLEFYSHASRIFPVTNQASSLLRALELELNRLQTSIEFDCEISAIRDSASGFSLVSTHNKKYMADKLIIACGGKSYPALGSNGSGYKLAQRFGHKITDLYPAALPLVVKDKLIHNLCGQRIPAKARAIVSNREIDQASGELLFTSYGLSGSAIIDVSREISLAINSLKIKDVYVSIDMVPFMGSEKLAQAIALRIKQGLAPQDLLTGILPNKFGNALKDILKTNQPEDIANLLKDKRFKVLATRGWNEAEFTAGGVSLGKIKEGTLESKLKDNLYFCGEVLDVDGARGGYNLTWAWASGLAAGQLGV